MDDAFKQELLDRDSTLDPDEALLWGWLYSKHRRTIEKQGAGATAEIAARHDVRKYLECKATFLRELSSQGLDVDEGADRQLARKLWWEYGYSVLTDEQDVHQAAEEAKKQVDSYVFGKAVASASVDGEVLVARFQERDVEAPVKLDDKQRAFVRAYSEFISKAIQLDYRILKFRNDVLGDPQRTLSHEEATKLIRSPAVQRLPLNFFTEMGTPVVEYTAKRMPGEGAPYNVYVEPPARFIDASEIQVRPMSFRWIGTNGVLEKHPVADFSVLGDLQELCKYLAKHHPITEEMAAYLVLCGGAVQVASLSGRLSNTLNAQVGAYAYDHSTITLTVPSWVRPKQVQQAYAKLRAQAWAKNSYRSRSDRNIAIFRFVIDRAIPLPPKDLIAGTRGVFDFPPWREMVEEWNKSLSRNHRWRFDQSGYTVEKRFRNAFVAGYEAITGQKYRALEALTTEQELKAELEARENRLIKALEASIDRHGNQQSEEES